MEPDFDKEIDALLRKEAAGRTITISEFGGIHLDADEITAFAEKKVPAGVRVAFIEHFAACDRCRKILLNAAWLNSEVLPEKEAAPVVPPVEAALPWYRRLFLFPNLAYVMGGLVVLFAGFIGLSVLTGINSRMAQDVSQAGTAEAPASAPVAANTAANSNAAMSTNAADETANFANTASTNRPDELSERQMANTNSAAANRPVLQATPPPAAAEPQPKQQQPAIAAAPPPPAPRDVAVTADDSRARNAAPVEDRKPAAAKEKERDEARLMAESTAPATTQMRSAAPRPEPKSADSAVGAGTAAAKKPSAPGTPTVRRTVGGRTFELRQGTWYDTGYRGQGTVTLKRSTPEYRKLDPGLRGIAESFMGTVVTLWNGRAYRIIP